MSPTTPILTQIEDAMVKMIEGITPGLYTYNWVVNETDLAKDQFPRANIFLDYENNLDDPEGPDSDMYFQEAFFRIEIIARAEQEYDNPRWEIQKDLNLALDDLKRLFGRDYTVNGTADFIMYRGMRIEYFRNNDIFIPAKLITSWRITYEQDRQSPESVA